MAKKSADKNESTPGPQRVVGPEPTNPSKRRGAFRLLWRGLDSLRGYFSELLRVKGADKANIYIQVFESAELADLNYWLQVVLSIGIATLGLILSSPAVVIGATLISPLMGPIFGVGLALALGDFYLGLKSLFNVVVSCLASVLLAALITWILPFHVATRRFWRACSQRYWTLRWRCFPAWRAPSWSVVEAAEAG